mgnify:CR=1 FL=1
MKKGTLVVCGSDFVEPSATLVRMSSSRPTSRSTRSRDRLSVAGTFEQILTFMGFCLGIFPIVAVLGVFKLRKRSDAVRSIPAYPLPPIIFIATSFAILLLAYFERPLESSVALATVCAGIPIYCFFTRHQRADGAAGKDDAQ